MNSGPYLLQMYAGHNSDAIKSRSKKKYLKSDMRYQKEKLETNHGLSFQNRKSAPLYTVHASKNLCVYDYMLKSA